jgi:hypothetical protein
MATMIRSAGTTTADSRMTGHPAKGAASRIAATPTPTAMSGVA